MSKAPRLLSRRQPDGTYRVHVSDGAMHHEAGRIHREVEMGPRRGKRTRWVLDPAPGLVPVEPHADKLGDARRLLLEAWTRRNAPAVKAHGLPGRFIVVEGGDGTGKTTLVTGLVAALVRQGHPVTQTEEPTRGPVGRIIRETLAGRGLTGEGDVSAQEWATLYAADRAHHLREGILPALARGDVVVCSRYVLSSLAYQGPALGLDWVDALNTHAPAPDVLLYLDAPVDALLARVQARGNADVFEVETRMREVATAYVRALAHVEAKGVRVVRLDATLATDALLGAALEAVQPLTTAAGDTHAAVP